MWQSINFPTPEPVGLVSALEAAGHRVQQRDGVWKSTNAVAAQAFIDAYNPLPAAKTDKIAAVKTLRAQKIATGAPYQGHMYQIDDAAHNNMVAVQSSFLKGHANAHDGYWRDASNVNVAMTSVEVQLFFDAMTVYKMAVARNTHTLIDAINGAANQAALDAVNINAGWP